MARLTGQAARQYILENQQAMQPQQNTGLIGGLVKGFTDPFTNFAKQNINALGYLGGAVGAGLSGDLDKYAMTGQKNFKPILGSKEEFDKYLNNSLLESAKTSAGVAAFAAPGGIGSGIKGLAAGGAVGGGLAGFGQGGDLESTLKGAAMGGLAGGGLGLAGKGLDKIGKSGIGTKISELKPLEKIKSYGQGAQQNAFTRTVGGTAGKKLGGAEFEREIFNFAKNSGMKVSSPDDLITLSDDLLNTYGSQVADHATTLSGKGVSMTQNLDNVVSTLESKMNKALPSEQAGIQKVIDDIQGFRTQGDDVLTTYRLKQAIGPKGKWSSVFDPNLKPQTDAYEFAYKELNKGLDDTFKGAGITNYREINKMNEMGIKAKQWGENNLTKNRQGALYNDPAGDIGLAASFATGNPLAMIPGTITGKAVQSPTFGRIVGEGLEKGATKLQNLPKASISMKGLPNILNNKTMQGFGQRALPIGVAMEGSMPKFPMSSPQMTPNFGEGGNVQQASGLLPSNQGGYGQGAPQMGQQQQMVMGLLSAGMKPSEIETTLGLLGLGNTNTQPQKLTENQIKTQVAATNAQEALNMLESGVATSGKVSNIKSKIGNFFGTSDPNQTSYRSKVASARSAAISMLSGANVPPSEYARLANSIPEDDDEPAIAKQKLQDFISTMRMYSSQGAAPTMVNNTGYIGY